MKIGIIGHFGSGKPFYDGQTIKTKIITSELCKKYGKSEVLKFDTHGGKTMLMKAPLYAWRAMRNTKNVIMLPGYNGLQVFGRLLPFLKCFFKNRKIHYVVIGGWLPEMLKNKKMLSRSLRKFDGIYVETNVMKEALEKQGFTNIFVMPNCKELTPLSASELVYQNEAPYKLCTFSRVMKEKGIEDAIEAVKAVNEKYGKPVYTLDIYGQVDAKQVEWFDKLKKDFPEYITYGGIVPFDKSVEVLKNYFALLFPTYYDGEGLAGTLIDSLSAGVPIIASNWKYNAEIVKDDIGFIFQVNNVPNIVEILCDILENIGLINDKKICCLDESMKYKPENAIKILLENLINS